jgi:hypothetical protein
MDTIGCPILGRRRFDAAVEHRLQWNKRRLRLSGDPRGCRRTPLVEFGNQRAPTAPVRKTNGSRTMR